MKRMLACTWAELHYQLDVIRATRVPMLRWTKAHIIFFVVIEHFSRLHVAVSFGNNIINF